MGVQFKIVNLANKEDYMKRGEVVLFDDGKAATKMAAYLTDAVGIKHQPRKIVTDDKWKEREAKRFRDGTYMPVPWESQRWWHNTKPDLEHFAHVSIERDAQIAFTADVSQGVSDKQTRMKPGRYLERYMGHELSGDTIRQWVAEFSIAYDKPELGLATTAEKIRHVYEHGPSSCMSHGIHEFQTRKLTPPMHPTEVYAAGDLAVAYLSGQGVHAPCDDCEDLCEGCDGDENTSYSARCVVWPEKKYFGRIYGDVERMKLLLVKEGYKAFNDMSGARLTRVLYSKIAAKGISNNDVFVCPYLDSNTKVRDDGKFLIIDDNGHISARHTGGYCIDERVKCSGCQKLVDPNHDRLHNYQDEEGNTGNYLCSACAKDKSKFVEDPATGYLSARKDMIWVEGFKPCHRSRVFTHFDVCSKSHWLCESKDMIVMLDGTKVSAAWFAEEGKRCPTCNLGMAKDATVGCGKPRCFDGVWMKENAALFKQATEFAVTHQKRDGYTDETPLKAYLEHYIARLEAGKKGVSV